MTATRPGATSAAWPIAVDGSTRRGDRDELERRFAAGGFRGTNGRVAGFASNRRRSTASIQLTAHGGQWQMRSEGNLGP